GNAIKQSCYALESLKLRYAVPDAALDFICGQGFNSMLSNWQCLIRTISRPEVNECDSRLSQNTVSSQLSLRALTEHPNAVCTTLRSYADCIRGPIESSCGNEVSNTALMIIERQARVILPFCTLAAGAVVPSLLLITASFLIAFSS
uniref:Uncharacterized protein n=1 Tax=Parascaris univalens TaxID=6257 RepID=A0A915AG12_PARUN